MRQPALNRDFEIRRDEIKGVPVLFCHPEINQPKPLILLSHGFTGNKGFWAPHLRQLAGLGYCAVALDNRAHGARSGASFHEMAFDGERLRLDVVRRLMKETADDIPLLIDHFVKRPDVDASRIAMAGVSMGGFATFRAMVVDERITVGAPIIASPFWDDLPRGVAIADDDASRLALKEIDAAFAPSRAPEKFADRPLLIQIGGADGHYDPARVQSFYDLLRAEYFQAHPDRLKLIIHDGVGHDFTPLMWSEALRWFERFLGPGKLVAS
jgi:uncharacterized protein